MPDDLFTTIMDAYNQAFNDTMNVDKRTHAKIINEVYRLILESANPEVEFYATRIESLKKRLENAQQTMVIIIDDKGINCSFRDSTLKEYLARGGTWFDAVDIDQVAIAVITDNATS